MLFLVKHLALTIHHCANEFFIVDIAMRVLLIHQKLLNLKKSKKISKFDSLGLQRHLFGQESVLKRR